MCTYTLKVLIMWFYQTPSSCGFSTFFFFFSITQIVVHSSEVPAQIWSLVSPRCRRMNGVFYQFFKVTPNSMIYVSALYFLAFQPHSCLCCCRHSLHFVNSRLSLSWSGVKSVMPCWTQIKPSASRGCYKDSFGERVVCALALQQGCQTHCSAGTSIQFYKCCLSSRGPHKTTWWVASGPRALSLRHVPYSEDKKSKKKKK